MSNIYKPFVYVEDKDVSAFKNKYLNTSDKDINNKISFLGESGQIMSKGNLYGHNILYINKSEYTQYVGITEDNPNYNNIYFINDGSTSGIGIVTHGQLYVNNPYWIKIVDDLPDTEEDNTIYLIKEDTL